MRSEPLWRSIERRFWALRRRRFSFESVLAREFGALLSVSLALSSSAVALADRHSASLRQGQMAQARLCGASLWCCLAFSVGSAVSQHYRRAAELLGAQLRVRNAELRELFEARERGAFDDRSLQASRCACDVPFVLRCQERVRRLESE